MISVPLLLGVLAACVLVGGVPSLVNTLKPRLQQMLQLDAERVDRLERMQFFLAWAFGMPLAGYFVDAWNAKDVLVAGCLGIAFTLAFFGITESPRWLSAVSFLLGLATSFLVVATLCLVPQAIPHPNCPAAAMSLAFVAVGVGSLTVVLPTLERWLGLRRSLMLLGLGALVPAILVFVGLSGLSAEEATAAVNAPALGFLYDGRFWLLVAMLLFYYPIESALDIWSGPFLQEIGYQERTRSMLVGFWISFLLARVAMWYLLGANDEIWLLALCVLTSAIVLGNLVGAYGASSGGVGFWLVGACYGPLLPGFLGLLLEIFPATPGMALGSVLALAGLHDALAQPLMRRATQTRPVRVAMRIPLVMTLLMLAPLLVLGLIKNTAGR